jgi:hypothetical protein
VRFAGRKPKGKVEEKIIIRAKAKARLVQSCGFLLEGRKILPVVNP